jgi:hypothetical protein
LLTGLVNSCEVLKGSSDELLTGEGALRLNGIVNTQNNKEFGRQSHNVKYRDMKRL